MDSDGNVYHIVIDSDNVGPGRSFTFDINNVERLASNTGKPLELLPIQTTSTGDGGSQGISYIQVYFYSFALLVQVQV